MLLGHVIKRTRLDRGKTIKEIAEEAKVTASLLSQIENQKANPSINSLMAIAKALHVPIASFFDAYEASESPVITSYARRQIPTADNVTYYLLTPISKDISIELKYTIYEKNGSSGHFHTHQGAECGIVLEGRLEVLLDEERYILEAGDSIYLDSTKPHNMKNLYDGRTITIWANSPPPSDTYN